MDIGAWQRGMYHLSKLPQNLDAVRIQSTGVVGIDPGKFQ